MNDEKLKYWWDEFPLRISSKRACMADVLNMSYGHFKNQRSAGRLPFATHLDGRTVYIYTDELLEHLNSFRLPRD